MSSAAAPRAQRPPLVEPGQIDHHVADMAVTVAADVTLGALHERLAEAGQWVALDGAPDAPLGELLQHDSTGPLRLGYGGWRDLLTGVQFTGGDEELVTVGGVTVKNVAGYDLVKFMVGSHGCFGRPVSATLRTNRRPEHALAVTLDPDDAHIPSLIAADAPPQWLLLTPRGLRAGWLGRAREIERLAPEVRALVEVEPELRSLKADEEERRRLLDVGIERLRIHLAPAEVRRFLREAPARDYAADPVFGVVWMRVPERLSDVLRNVEALGGDAVWSGRDGIRAYGLSASQRTLLERLKARLDPNLRLPGLPFAG